MPLVTPATAVRQQVVIVGGSSVVRRIRCFLFRIELLQRFARNFSSARKAITAHNVSLLDFVWLDVFYSVIVIVCRSLAGRTEFARHGVLAGFPSGHRAI